MSRGGGGASENANNHLERVPLPCSYLSAQL